MNWVFNIPFRRCSLSRAWLLVSFQRSPARFTSRPKNSGLLGFWVSAVPLSRIAWNTFLFLSSWSMTYNIKCSDESVSSELKTRLVGKQNIPLSFPCIYTAVGVKVRFLVSSDLSQLSCWIDAHSLSLPNSALLRTSKINCALLRTSAIIHNWSCTMSLCYLGAQMIITENQISVIQRLSCWATNYNWSRNFDIYTKKLNFDCKILIFCYLFLLKKLNCKILIFYLFLLLNMLLSLTGAVAVNVPVNIEYFDVPVKILFEYFNDLWTASNQTEKIYGPNWANSEIWKWILAEENKCASLFKNHCKFTL